MAHTLPTLPLRRRIHPWFAVLVMLAAVGAAHAQSPAQIRTRFARLNTREASSAAAGLQMLRHTVLQQPMRLLPAAQYHIFDSLINVFSYYSVTTQPLAYDAPSNTLVTIKRGATGTSDNIYVRRSSDGGNSWGAAMGPLNNSSLGLARYPGITIANKNGSSNPADLLYHATFPVTISDAFGTTFEAFLDGSLTLMAPAEANAGTSGFIWGTDAIAMFDEAGTTAVTAGEMSGNNIGVRHYSSSTGDLKAEIPPALQAANFVDPGDPNSRTSVLIGCGRSGGSMYIGVMARFPSTSAALGPFPAVTASTDGGGDWGELEVLPIATVRAYAQSQGADPDSTFFPYSLSQDFVVTDANAYSFYMNLAEVNATKTTVPEVRQVVEVYRENGTWGIRKVADVSGSFFTFAPVPPATDRSNQVANEVHVARTADGAITIVKWVDLVQRVYEDDVDGDAVTPDTVVSSDVFMAIRKGSSTEWSRPMNVTNSDIIDRVTWMPPVVANGLTNVPLLTLQRKLSGSESTDRERWIDAQLVEDQEQYVTMSSIDISALAGVEAPVHAAAEATRLTSVRWSREDDAAAIGIDVPANNGVRVEVWNNEGRRVGVLADGPIEAGRHDLRFDSRGLASGAYYVTATTGAQTTACSMIIAR